MKVQNHTFQAQDNKTIHYYQWSPEDNKDVKAVVQISHGMAEHAGRYDIFAILLMKRGYAVFGNDHRGHGKTAGGRGKIGYFEDGDFWEKAILDMHDMNHIASKKYPGKPIFLFGHSMGSLLSRDYISRYGNELPGVILSATSGDPGRLGKIGLFIAKTEAFIRGRKKLSPLLNALSFGKFNRPFKPARTKFDWLSRSEYQVDRYIMDPFCGTVFTTGFFIDLINGINKINDQATYDATPELPMFFVSGDKDPVGAMGLGVREVAEKYTHEDVTVELYQDFRHEILNETDNDYAIADILAWLDQVTAEQ